ncbi:hypothetical protein [Ruegeria sp. HKCCD8929]|uniref:DUF6998 domain-containing protein n=1 Tax=Ruegeria sp. HKCCD8929 TaxID=2683006 RepID=UPI001488DCEC|nr:hypothetical protein [Ruegeria sp. HKCCD8929]
MRTEFEILEDVKTLAIEYYNVTEKPLGVTGEIAEFEAARLLDLHLTEAHSEGYDAVRVTGGKRQTVQIKGRRKGKRRSWGMVPSINTDKAFYTVVLVLLTEGFAVHEIWEAPRRAVVDTLDKPGSTARNERRAMPMSKFKSIGHRVWSPASK